MGGTEQPHMDKYMEITKDWNCDDSCTLTSLPVCDLENFKRLICVAQCVPTYEREIIDTSNYRRISLL
jgi:hypothetical protein